MIRAIFKIPAFVFVVSIYIAISILFDLIVRNDNTKKAAFTRITTAACRIGLWIFGIKVDVRNVPRNSEMLNNVLVVSNHLSYLDILIISSVFPSLYITSVEVQHTFFLGLMSRLAGSLFVERRNKTKLLKEIDAIATVLKSGFTITLFPEGTSSNGDNVLPFKSSLFSAAEKAEITIQPICIRYMEIDNHPITPKTRDYAYYYGDIQFFPHLMNLFTVESIKVRLSFLDQVKTNSWTDRKEMVDTVHKMILDSYNVISGS